MISFGPEREGAAETVFRDAILLALLGFVLISVILLIHFNPEAKEADSEPPGNVIVEISWPAELNTDVDLWVEAPGDVPVGYSNKGSTRFNLLRDDLGHYEDPSGINYEVSYSRGIVAGEYVVNLHLYRNLAPTSEIPVHVVVSAKPDVAAGANRLLETDVVLRHPGEEVTAARFRLTADGTLVQDSVHARFKPLRATAVETLR